MAMYCYPAVFTAEEAGYSVEFPDIENCFTCGETLPEALVMAKAALEMMMCDLEDHKKPIPAVSDIKQITAPDSGMVSMVLADTTAYRKKTSSQAVKKTLSIPSYLNEAAENAGINFSQTLQEALAVKLGFSS